MANKYTKTPLPPKKEIKKLYNSGMTQLEISFYYKTSQKVVWRWMRDLKIKQRIPVKRNQIGENNDSWKGKNAGYAALHIRVQKIRGKPKKCEHCGTIKAKKYEWASKNKNYSDPNDYIRLCKSCHLKLDTFRSSQGWAVSKSV